jgi:hypothetical protein
MEERLAYLLEPFLEALLECIFALVAELLTESTTTAFETYSILREERGEVRVSRPFGSVAVSTGFLIMVTAIGIVWSVDFPQRLILRTYAIPGVSMLLAPVAAGLAMYWFGNWRRKHGGHPSRLATFWGGALFGFGVALARFLMVGR